MTHSTSSPRTAQTTDMKIHDIEVAVSGRIFKTARLCNEWYDFVEDPHEFLDELKKTAGIKADLFTFLQEPDELEQKYSFHMEQDSISVMPISTFDDWFKNRINAKTRNMIRKAEKSGVEIRPVECDANFVEGVVAIYNEVPVRQGMRFWHYGKGFETVKADMETFRNRSRYVGAFHNDDMIGFIKLTMNTNSASLMQIISKIAHRDKAPTNALLARAVEMCAELHVPYLKYGVWSKGGLGAFKEKHGFERFQVPRYFVPLSLKGSAAIGLRLYREPTSLIPERVLDQLRSLRNSWYSLKRYEQHLRSER